MAYYFVEYCGLNGDYCTSWYDSQSQDDLFTSSEVYYIQYDL
jgi:hypothetical protein